MAAEEGYVNTYTICPGAINGVGYGPVNRTSLHTKVFASTFLALKKAITFGDGTNVYGFVRLSMLPVSHITHEIDCRFIWQISWTFTSNLSTKFFLKLVGIHCMVARILASTY